MSSLTGVETLVLSQTYEPVARISWKRAISLIWEGKVEVIEEYLDKVARSVSIEIKIPSVIRFLRGTRAFKKGIRFSRENVFVRDRATCQYCGKKVTKEESTYDHVVPRAKGGLTKWDNIVISCVRCNQRKGGRTPEEAKMKLLSLPIKPKTLPNALKITLSFRDGMPDSWKHWLKDQLASAVYWNSELEE